MPSEQRKAIFVGRRNSKLAKALLESGEEQELRFVSPKMTIGDFLEEVSRGEVSGQFTFYYQRDGCGYGYDVCLSQHSVDPDFFSKHASKMFYNILD